LRRDSVEARRTRGFQGGRERAVVVRRAKCPPEIEARLDGS
jgi:hypothetical protein